MSPVVSQVLPTPAIVTQPWQSGRYYWAPNATGIGVGTFSNGSMRALPFYIPNVVTLSRIGAEVTIIGDVGSKVRLGIYADDGTGRPGALVIDAGTIAGDSVAVQEIMISQVIGPGIFYATGVTQVVTVTSPTVREPTSAPIVASDQGGALPAAGQASYGWALAGVTAALPTPFGAAVVSGGGYRIIVKVA